MTIDLVGFIQVFAVVSASLIIIYKSFKSDQRITDVMGTIRDTIESFKETCKLRHNPIDIDLQEMKKDVKALLLSVTELVTEHKKSNGK